MFGRNHYVPIVRWKRGERKALELLDSTLKSRMTPLIEVPQIEWDYDKEEPKKTIDAHLSGIAEQMKKSWNHEGRVFVDLFQVCLEDDETMEDGQHPLEYVIGEIMEAGIEVVPVVSNFYGENYKQAVKNIVNKNKTGCCLRVKEQDENLIEETILWINQYLNLGINDVDLILDYEYINPKQESRIERFIIGSISTLPRINEWRSFTICGTSMPENLGEIPTGTDGLIRRSEWHIYSNLLSMDLARQPSFGDYIISNPKYPDLNPKVIQMAASIRYTSVDNFLIYRGYSIKSPNYNGWGQALDLTSRIILSPSFSGKAFSYGDEYIYKCANESVSTGNAETWRRVGTNHHLTLIIKELANLHDTSTVDSP